MFAWPIVPTLAVVLVLNRSEVIRLAVGYVVIGGVAVAMVTFAGQVLRGSFNDAPLTNVSLFVASLAFTAALPLGAARHYGWRRIRAVTPLALSTTLVFGFAVMLFREALTEAFNLEAFDRPAGAGELTTNSVVLRRLHDPRAPGGLDRLAAPAVPGDALRTQTLQRRAARRRLLVAHRHGGSIATQLSTTYGLGGIAAGVAAFAAYRSAWRWRWRGCRVRTATIRRSDSSSCVCSDTRPAPKRSSTAWRSSGASTGRCS